nr:hypothetical protein [Tanacetum cinerariifolium]
SERHVLSSRFGKDTHAEDADINSVNDKQPMAKWHERFMNYLEEQTDGEAMINSIQNGLSNDIYSLIDSNKTANLWDALERQMHGSEYGEQDRKAVILYEYETFKAIEGEQLLDTYL